MTSELYPVMPEAEQARCYFYRQMRELFTYRVDPRISKSMADWVYDKYELLDVEPPKSKVPKETADQYVDTALALGVITNRPVNQDQLFLLVAARNILRMQWERPEEEIAADSDGTEQQKLAQDVQKDSLFYVMDLFENHPQLINTFDFIRD